MKTIWMLFAAVLLVTAAAPPARADVRVSLDFFYDNLDPHGTWREVGDYGYCWQPRDVDPDWQPYSEGRWVYTDVGWTWDSDEPFSWAVYHYGRWALVEDVGWVWVPDTQWGPGWVSWRRSDDYIGWAPLPPEARFVTSMGFSSWVDHYYDIGPRNYHFVQTRDFGDRRLRSRFVDPRQNITIINNTTNITHITYANSVVHNGGPRFEEVSRVSAQPIQRFRLERQQRFEGNPETQRGDSFRSRREGDTLRVFAPPVELRASAAPKRLAERVDRVAVNRGWKDAGTAVEVEQLRSKIKSKSKTPAELPPQPKFENPIAVQGRDAAGRRGQPQSGDASQPGAGRPRVADAPPSVNPNKPTRGDQPLEPGASTKPATAGADRPGVTPTAADKPPGAPGTERGTRQTKPMTPSDDPARDGKPPRTIATPSVRTDPTENPTAVPGKGPSAKRVPQKPGDAPATTPRKPGDAEVPPSVKPSNSPRGDQPPGTGPTAKPATPVEPAPREKTTRVPETQRVRPQDSPPPARMPEKKPDLPQGAERGEKSQRPDQTPKMRKPDRTPISEDSRPPRPNTPAPPVPESTRPSQQGKKTPPSRDEKPAAPQAPLPQRKPEPVAPPPAVKPPTTAPAPTADQGQQGKNKSNDKDKEKKKDDPEKK